jgi:RNA recognition motif-containing protein
LREVRKNQDELEKRFSEYAFVQKETDREINGKGELKKETTKVYEVFPIANREPVMKLISENGVPLSGERLAKETKRVEEEFLKAERDQEKDKQRVEKNRAERERKRAERAKKSADEDEDVDISQFFKVHEFVSPRVERFRERDAVVFDFRVRPGYKPANRQEELISKLVGVAWIDPVDKQVIRMEAKLAEGFKMGGGLLVNLRPAQRFLWNRRAWLKESGCRVWPRSIFRLRCYCLPAGISTRPSNGLTISILVAT